MTCGEINNLTRRELVCIFNIEEIRRYKMEIENQSGGYLTDIEWCQFVNHWEDLLFGDEEELLTISPREWQAKKDLGHTHGYLVMKLVKGLCNRPDNTITILNGMTTITAFSVLSKLVFDLLMTGIFTFGYVTPVVAIIALFQLGMYGFLLFRSAWYVRDGKRLFSRYKSALKLIEQMNETYAEV